MATEQSVMAVIRASRPTFRQAHDKVAFAVHAAFLASGFVLHATGPSASTDDALSSSSTDEVGIDHWNESEDSYAFVYSKPEKSSKKVLVKCLAMNNKLLIDTLRDGDNEPLHLELSVEDYIVKDGGTNYNAQFKNLGKLVGELNKEVLSKYSGSSVANSSTQTSSSGKGGLEDQPGAERRSDYPYQPGSSFPSGYVVPPIPGSGGSDLFPGPGAGVYPTRGEPGGGSMLVGPNDPRFFGGMGGDPRLPGGLPGVPPGARFDPYGPPDVPGFEPGRFIRDPRRPGGGRPHPDLPHFGGDSDFI
ncbi:PREDICTED: probable proteasome inhibitor [Nicotiana attenuata]|uniref:Proteasome inhibitor n=1 Tax=Nicotiana attenuata TaxID=49451 RepID=A0A314LDH8_NICAT|nr:PREDICTED: probable proteasome inhibitor [Nicotiana attenuata]OIT39139.1 putative proteasome inhibitor [Nicotiana attenuata]